MCSAGDHWLVVSRTRFVQFGQERPHPYTQLRQPLVRNGWIWIVEPTSICQLSVGSLCRTCDTPPVKEFTRDGAGNAERSHPSP